MYGDTAHAATMASTQRITATDLHATGTVQHVVPEPADDTPQSLAQALAAECATHLAGLAV
jgi:acetyl-CoA carboxylase carboxyl transferase subunit beta